MLSWPKEMREESHHRKEHMPSEVASSSTQHNRQ
jgi:hypothetical protein